MWANNLAVKMWTYKIQSSAWEPGIPLTHLSECGKTLNHSWVPNMPLEDGSTGLWTDCSSPHTAGTVSLRPSEGPVSAAHTLISVVLHSFKHLLHPNTIRPLHHVSYEVYLLCSFWETVSDRTIRNVHSESWGSAAGAVNQTKPHRPRWWLKSSLTSALCGWRRTLLWVYLCFCLFHCNDGD